VIGSSEPGDGDAVIYDARQLRVGPRTANALGMLRKIAFALFPTGRRVAFFSETTVDGCLAGYIRCLIGRE
jgi:hypothetical protein